MANSDNFNAGGVPFGDRQPTLEDVTALLDLHEAPPLDEAEERMIRVFKTRLGAAPHPAQRSKNRCPRRGRPLPDQHFRPSLEDLGPRELSSFPVSVQGLGANLAGAAGMAIPAVGRPPETAPRTLVLPTACAAVQPSPAEHRQGPVSLMGGGGVDTQVLDKYFSNCRTNPDDLPGLLPEFGTVLLLGSLRQDQDLCPPQPGSASFPGPRRNRRGLAARPVVLL
jgi:hypothetical protein